MPIPQSKRFKKSYSPAHIAVIAVSVSVSITASFVSGATFIDVPPSVAPNSIGGETVLNLRNGGTLPFNFQALNGATVNILGGSVAGRMLPQFGSTINISGGVIGNGGSSLLPQDGSVLHISGGAIGDSFEAESGVSISMEGYDFRINGQPIPGLDQAGNSILLDVTLTGNAPSQKAFSGIYADGTPFLYVGYEGDSFANDLQLIRSSAPASAPTDITISNATTLHGALPSQTLNVVAGGILPTNFNAAHASRVNVTGGTIGDNFEAQGAQLALDHATVGPNFTAVFGSNLYASDSTLERLQVYYDTPVHLVDCTTSALYAGYNSPVILEGGAVGELRVTQSSVEVTGTTITDRLWLSDATAIVHDGPLSPSVLLSRSATTVLGGESLTQQFTVDRQSNITIHGTNFLLNGQPFGEALASGPLNVTARDGAVLSGTLADGTAFSTKLFTYRVRPIGAGLFVSSDSSVQIVLVPEPAMATVVLGVILFLPALSRAR
jgi:hypothetical protein